MKWSVCLLFNNAPFWKIDKRRRGHVLLMTLLLLAVVVTSLAVSARLSVRKTLQAAYARDQLQRRWAALSCQGVWLPRVNDLLTIHEGQVQRSVAQRGVRFQLSHMTVDVVLSDEQAKANIAAIAVGRGPTPAEQIARELLREMGQNMRVRVKPLTLTANQRSKPLWTTLPTIGSPSQVFADASALQLFGEMTLEAELSEDFVHRGALDAVTCWGDGRLQIRTVPRYILERVAAGIISRIELDALVAARTDNPSITVADAVTLLGLDADRSQQIQELLTDQSDCFSVRIALQGRQRTWRYLSVIEQSTSDASANDRWFDETDAAEQDLASDQEPLIAGADRHRDQAGARVYRFVW